MGGTGFNPQWPHVLSVEEVRMRRTSPLSIIDEASSVGSRSQLSRGQFSPTRFSDVPPVPAIPAMYRQPGQQVQGESPPQLMPSPSLQSISSIRSGGSGRSRSSGHARALTDPGARPLSGVGAMVPQVAVSPSSSIGSIRSKILFYEDRDRTSSPGGFRTASPYTSAPSPFPPTITSPLTSARSTSPGPTHVGGLGLSLARSPAYMLSTPFSPAQSMPSPMGRASSPVKSVTSTKSYSSSEGNDQSYDHQQFIS
jgi:hypothetical protein